MKKLLSIAVIAGVIIGGMSSGLSAEDKDSNGEQKKNDTSKPCKSDVPAGNSSFNVLTEAETALKEDKKETNLSESLLESVKKTFLKHKYVYGFLLLAGGTFFTHALLLKLSYRYKQWYNKLIGAEDEEEDVNLKARINEAFGA